MRPVIDNRFRYGESAPWMDLPECGNGDRVTDQRKVLYCHTEAGHAHDQQRCREYLKPGNIYRVVNIEVHSSSSSVELADFPGVRFNTVAFCDWPLALERERGQASINPTPIDRPLIEPPPPDPRPSGISGATSQPPTEVRPVFLNPSRFGRTPVEIASDIVTPLIPPEVDGHYELRCRIRDAIADERTALRAARARADRLQGEVEKWQRIRKPMHGSCCTCQACGLVYDECRCDLDDVADALKQAQPAVRLLDEMKREEAGLVEAMAEHLYYSTNGHGLSAWERASESVRGTYRQQARAVLRALVKRAEGGCNIASPPGNG